MSVWKGGVWASQKGINAVGPWKGSLWRSERSLTSLGIKKLLFGQGQQGVMYVPKPTVDGQQVLFQDSAGTTPVTADGQPVGYIKDLSGNGNHATQSTAAAKPLYRTDGTLHWLEGDGVNDVLTVPGSSTSLAFLTNTTGSTLQFVFDKAWPADAASVLAGNAYFSSLADGMDLFVDDRSPRSNRLRSINPGGVEADSASLDNAVDLTQPTIVEFRQSASDQTISSTAGKAHTSITSSSVPNNDFRIFGLPDAAGTTSGSVVSSGILKFHGGIITSEHLGDLSDTRQYLANLAGVTL